MKKFQSILIVDDDPVSNYMTRNFFNRINICEEYHFCKNGKEALRFIDLHSNVPELILVDLNSPVMDGFEFIQHLENKGVDELDSRVIIYTAEVPEKFSHYQFNYIDKPLTFEKFCNATGIRLSA